MSTKRRPPAYPTPSEVVLAPGDRVVLLPRNHPPARAKDYLFGDVGSPPYWAYVQNRREDRVGLRHPYRRVVLAGYRVLAVYRAGACIAKVLEPTPKGVWCRLIPSPPADLVEEVATPRQRRQRRNESWRREFVEDGWVRHLPEGSWTYKKLDVVARVWYKDDVTRWNAGLVLGPKTLLLTGFPSDRKALSAARTRILSTHPGTTPCP